MQGLMTQFVRRDEEDVHAESVSGRSINPSPSLPPMHRSSYLSLSTGDLHVTDSGGPGRPVVLVHGLGGQHTNWLDVRERLEGLGRVISVDLPGFGLSPPLPSATLEGFAGVVIEVAEHFGGDAVLVGNSMGGLISEMAASSRSDLIAGLVLIAPATRRYGARPVDLGIFARLALQSLPGTGPMIASLYRRVLTPERQVEETMALVAADPDRISRRIWEASLGMARRRRSMPWAVRTLTESTASVRRILLDSRRFDEIVHSITAPTLLLGGARDRIVPPAAIAGLASERPDWTWIEHPDLGHVPQMEDPGWTMEQIESWADDTIGTRSHAS